MRKVILLITILMPATSNATFTCSMLNGAYVYSQESPQVYLGFFGNGYASDSIMNSYGSYGSSYSSTSVRNEFGTYGSPFSSYSANNDYTSTPPIIYKNGEQLGYLTTNDYLLDNLSLTLIDSECSFSATAPDKMPLAPQSMNASDGDYADKIVLSWSPVTGATSYTIYYSTSLDGNKYALAPVTSTSLDVTGAVLDQIYYFWPQANNADGSGLLGSPDSGYITTLTNYTLTVDLTSAVTTGSGSVVSTGDNSIDCGSLCEASYPAGTKVILTANPDESSTFFMWSSIDCEDGFYANPCTLTMNGDLSTLVAFDLKGDLDADGNIGVEDAVLGLQVLSGMSPSNVNGWGKLNDSEHVGLPEVLYIMDVLGNTP